TVTATDLNHCSTITRTVIVTQPSAMAIALNSQTNVACYGALTGSATVTASGGPSTTYTYLWSNGQTGQTATGLTAGTYTVTATGGTGCTATRLVTITENPLLIASATATNIACDGAATGAVSSSVSGGV